MIQNSPLFVAPASPAKNATSSNAPTTNATKQTVDQGESFKQVLSKQVKQDDGQTKKPIDKAVDKKVSHEETQDQLKGKQASAKAKAEDQQASLLIAESDVAGIEKETVDAQHLASTTTAKSVEDATDGEVVLAVAPEKDATQLPIANFTPLVQPTLTQETVIKNVETLAQGVVAPSVAPTEQPSTDLTSGPVDKGEVVAKKVSQQPAEVVTDNGKAPNQFANYLSADRRPQGVQEQLGTQGSTSAVDVNAIATSSIQNIAKTATPQMLPQAQAGLSNTINAYPGKTGWNEAISQKVMWMVGATEQSATLTLNPKDLGPLQVIINVNNEKADATFISENPEVRKALEEGMSSLRQSMGQAGVELGQANVNTSKQHQDFQQASKEYFARQAESRSNVEEGSDVTSSTLPRTRTSNGLVDTFV